MAFHKTGTTSLANALSYLGDHARRLVICRLNAAT